MLSNLNKKAAKTVQIEEKQFIVFLIGEEQFGVDVKQAREIITTTDLTFVPKAPDFVKGVINLRGEIIPIIDLKRRLGLNGSTGDVENQKIIVVELDNSLIGMQVDDVKEMIRLYKKDIATPPKIVKGINRDYLSGVGKLEDKLLILLNLNKILSEEEFLKLDRMEME